MSEFTPLVGKQIKFSASLSKEGAGGKMEHSRQEAVAKVIGENLLRRIVQLGESPQNCVELRFEGVTVVEVEGKSYADFLGSIAPPPADKPHPIRWNPLVKAVLNHETGETDLELTKLARPAMGLPELPNSSDATAPLPASGDVEALIAVKLAERRAALLGEKPGAKAKK